MIYAWRHPRRIERSVMLAANPPGHFVWDAGTVDRQIRDYARLCAAARDCRSRTDDLAGLIRRRSADVPSRWGPLKIKAGNVRTASFWGLIDSSDDAAPLSAPMTIDSWLAADRGDPSGLWFLSLGANLIFPRVQVWGDVAAVARADADAADAHFARRPGRGSILSDSGSRFIWAGGGGLAHAWPSAPDDDRYDRVRTSGVETLVVSGSLDFAAPASVAARELMPHLPNGRQVVLREFGHTTDVWNAQPAATTRLITRFLGDEGRGNDRIDGGSGNDRLSGGAGADRMKGARGRDRISGGSGNDRISSRDGRRDRVNCGRGRDRLIADRVDVVARNCERVRRTRRAKAVAR